MRLTKSWNCTAFQLKIGKFLLSASYEFKVTVSFSETNFFKCSKQAQIHLFVWFQAFERWVIQTHGDNREFSILTMDTRQALCVAFEDRRRIAKLTHSITHTHMPWCTIMEASVVQIKNLLMSSTNSNLCHEKKVF